MQKLRSLLLPLCLLLVFPTNAQFVDDFSDGDFTSNPEWFGQTDRFIVDNFILRLNAPAVAATSYLVTSSQAIENATWEFFVKLDFNPSGTNLARVYLIADSPDLTQPLNGYFVRIGGTEDEVSLYRQSGSTITKIIDGEDKRIDFNVVEVKVKVTRDDEGNWELFSDVGATSNYIQEGNTVKDETHLVSNYFGVSCIYTQTRSTHFYFDDFVVTGIPVTDKFPPEVMAIEIVDANSLKIIFNEEVEAVSAISTNNYELSEGLGSAQSVSLEENNTQVLVQFASPFPNGKLLTLTIHGVEDLSGNAIGNYQTTFRYFVPEPAEWKDIIITEFFPDPDPPVGLPNQEFVEIYNRSNKVFNLLNWKLIDPGASGTLKEHYLFPGDYLILGSNTNAPLFDAYGQTMGITGMPILSNNGDILELRDPDGKLIDSLSYDLTWYQDNSKRDGGWTIEVIDVDNFCTDKENYRASVNESGGTPGAQNSVYELIEDNVGPILSELTNVNEKTLMLKFSERLNSDAIKASFTTAPTLTPLSILFANSFRDEITIQFEETLQFGATYQVEVSNVFDCKGNNIDPINASAEIFIVAEPPQLLSIEVISATNLELTFSEETELSSATTLSNYELSDDVNPININIKAPNIIELIFAEEFINGRTYSLLVRGVKGVYENEIIPVEKSFLFFRPVLANKYDIIITELFPDPAPPVNLPEHEFVEIYNRSAHPFELSGWKLIDPGATGSIPSYLLQPGEYVILTSVSGVPKFESFGKVLGVPGMPVLNNNADQVYLVSPEGLTIDSVSYQLSWYRDNEKRDGGWTLERIDYDDFCNDADNWIASTDNSGGTPGRINAVFAKDEQAQAPRLADVLVENTSTVLLQFDKKLNRQALSGEFMIEPAIAIANKMFSGEQRNEVEINFAVPLQLGGNYSLRVQNVFDCRALAIDKDFNTIAFTVVAAPPKVKELIVLDANHLVIKFSEELETASAENKSNYSVSDEIASPVNVNVLSDNKSVELFFLKSFVNGRSYQISIKEVKGLYNNEIEATEKTFLFFQPVPAQYKDIIITELFPDPTPPVGLPEYEFVEIYNRSEHPFDLTGWRLVDPGANGTIPPYLIQPGEYIILASAAAASRYQSYGTTLTVANMPVLTNAADQVYLVSPEGLTVDSVSYQLGWYKDNDKRDGGWTLELIDLNDVCREAENWAASEHPDGGTPGRINSINASRPDLTGPKLLQAIALNEFQLLLRFNEKLAETSPDQIRIDISENVEVAEIYFYDESKTQLLIVFSHPIQASKKYGLSVTEVYDCPGNKIQEQYRDAEFVLTEEALPGDVVINEILFNPRPGGVDFVEIYNNSQKYFNIKNWFIGNYVSNIPTSLRLISNQDELFAPGAFKILTSNIDVLKGDYPQTKEAVAHIVNLPSYPDREGSVSLVDASNVLLDYFIYHENFHNPMLRSKEGVSLERVSASTETNLEANWKSAASVSGFATPGFVNSSARKTVSIETSGIKIEPEVFIPQYGVEDFVRIIYSFEQAGLSANVFIIDQQGRKVKTIANNEIINQDGFLTWDGSDDNGTKVRMGPYLIYFQLFNSTGELQTIRKRVVVASRF
jgi:hypothetical protein